MRRALICGMLACLTLLGAFGSSGMAVAATDRDQVAAFLTVTGFDAAIETLGQSAAMAPALLGRAPDEFGADWTRLVDNVFAPTSMRNDAAQMLAATLDDAMLNHAAEFYASDLGQRLVLAENASHRTPSDQKTASEGAAAVQAARPDRIAVLQRMIGALDATETGARALEEIQIRFLQAADAAGMIDLQVDVARLRALIAESRAATMDQMERHMLENSVVTYAMFSDADLQAYAAALEAPLMRQVYGLMNAVQFEIMVQRFETLALRMAELRPGKDL